MPGTRRATLTVITPCLDAGRYLERTICSVLDQNRRSVEYLVVDGGSRDDSVALIQAYERELAGWRSGPDQGPAAAINWALTRAGGSWVMVLPAGDVLMPGAIDAVVAAVKADPDARWLTGHAQRLDEQDHTVGITIAPGELTLMRWLMHDTAPAAVASNVYHRSLFAEAGEFDTGLSMAWSYEFHARLLAAGHRPRVIAADLAGQRQETYRLPRVERTLRRGVEQITVGERYLDRLMPDQRSALWQNLDLRRQIHALAEAEAAGAEGQRLLWRRMMDRPWWINSDRYRRALTAAANVQRQAHAVTPAAPEPRRAA